MQCFAIRALIAIRESPSFTEGDDVKPRCAFAAPVAQLDRASGFEPEGREFESLRARQSINYPLIGNAQLTKRSENVAFSATFLPRGATFGPATSDCRSIRLATDPSFSGARCAYRSTISYDRQPPSSISSCSEVPLCTCQEAQVCLLCCRRHRKHYPQSLTMSDAPSEG